jgi:hypothetical protein
MAEGVICKMSVEDLIPGIIVQFVNKIGENGMPFGEHHCYSENYVDESRASQRPTRGEVKGPFSQIKAESFSEIIAIKDSSTCGNSLGSRLHPIPS